MTPYASFLFAQPSFAEGVARSLDLGGTLQEYNRSFSPEQADVTALHMDWCAIRKDLLATMDEMSEMEQVSISEDLLAQAHAALNISDQLELPISDGR